MKKVIFYALALMVSGLSLQSCSTSDKDLQTNVQNELRKRTNQVTATVNNGVATLQGTVNTDAERFSVDSIARSVKNIKSVVNNTTVKAAAPVVQIDNDGTIRSSITSALTAAGYNTVLVEVKDGEVTLSGNLKRADLQKVMQIANEANVRKVTNNIDLK